MARLILQTILFVALISALYGAPTSPPSPPTPPTPPRNIGAPAIATLDAKPKEEHHHSGAASSEEALIRPARNPHHDGTDHEQPAAIAKLDEHIDHGSSTTPKPRETRAAEEDKKKNETPGHTPSEVLKDIKDEVTTSAKPRTARAAEKDEKHEDSHGHDHPASLTKDSQEHKKDAATKEQARPARETDEEKKGAVHDQPIPIPSTLKEEHHHTEEKKEEDTKHKRETDDSKSDEKNSDEKDDSKEDQSKESPLTYTKINTEQKEGDDYLALPNKESEYDRHVRQSNDEHHSNTKDIVTLPEHPHSLSGAYHIHKDSSGSSSSEEDKSNSS